MAKAVPAPFFRVFRILSPSGVVEMMAARVLSCRSDGAKLASFTLSRRDCFSHRQTFFVFSIYPSRLGARDHGRDGPAGDNGEPSP